MEDLGWICVNSWRYGRVDKVVGGFGDLEDVFEGYAAAGDAPVDRAAAKWWQVFGSLGWVIRAAFESPPCPRLPFEAVADSQRIVNDCGALSEAGRARAQSKTGIRARGRLTGAR
jgi:hypothetical protein